MASAVDKPMNNRQTPSLSQQHSIACLFKDLTVASVKRKDILFKILFTPAPETREAESKKMQKVSQFLAQPSRLPSGFLRFTKVHPDLTL